MEIYRPKGLNKSLNKTEDTPTLYIKATGEVYSGTNFHYDLTKGAYFTGKPSDPTMTKEELMDGVLEVEAGIANNLFIPKNQYDKLAKDNSGYNLRYTHSLPSREYVPTQDDYNLGSYGRYFAQHKLNGYIVEIDKQTFKDLKSQSTKYHYPSFFIGSMPWIIRGPVADQEINGYIVLGASARNEQNINLLQEQLPNIKRYLTDTAQFVR